MNIHSSASDLVLLDTGVGVGSGSEDVEDAGGTVDVLGSADSIEELEGVEAGAGVGVGVGVGEGVGVGVTTATEDVSVELIAEDVGTAEVVVTMTGRLELEGAMEEVVLGVVVAIELAVARQSVTA